MDEKKMKKKIDELENQMLSHIDVSDSVLDKARGELLSEQSEKIKNSTPVYTVGFPSPAYNTADGGTGVSSKIKSKRHILIAVAVCAVLIAAAVLITVLIWSDNSFQAEPQYKSEELDKRSVESILSYNKENSTDYLCITESQTQSYAYYNGTCDILLSETFTYNGYECVWYVWTDNKDLRVDLLFAFDDCTDEVQIADYDVLYNVGDENIKAYFMSERQGYYFRINSSDINLATEILEAILS